MSERLDSLAPQTKGSGRLPSREVVEGKGRDGPATRPVCPSPIYFTPAPAATTIAATLPRSGEIRDRQDDLDNILRMSEPQSPRQQKGLRLLRQKPELLKAEA